RAVRQVVRQLGPNFLHRLFGDGQFILGHISQQTFRNRPDRTRGFPPDLIAEKHEQIRFRQVFHDQSAHGAALRRLRPDDLYAVPALADERQGKGCQPLFHLRQIVAHRRHRHVQLICQRDQFHGFLLRQQRTQENRLPFIRRKLTRRFIQEEKLQLLSLFRRTPNPDADSRFPFQRETERRQDTLNMIQIPMDRTLAHLNRRRQFPYGDGIFFAEQPLQNLPFPRRDVHALTPVDRRFLSPFLNRVCSSSNPPPTRHISNRPGSFPQRHGSPPATWLSPAPSSPCG